MENYQFYKFRKTSQQLLPPVIDQTDFGYRIFPSHHIGDNKIFYRVCFAGAVYEQL